MDEAYLEIEEKVFEKVKDKSKEEFKEEFPNGDREDIYWFGNLSFDSSEEEYKDGFLTLSGDLILDKSEEKIGFISIKQKMDSDRTLEVINDYMKRLGKLKTVLEATK